MGYIKAFEKFNIGIDSIDIEEIEDLFYDLHDIGYEIDSCLKRIEKYNKNYLYCIFGHGFIHPTYKDDMNNPKSILISIIGPMDDKLITKEISQIIKRIPIELKLYGVTRDSLQDYNRDKNRARYDFAFIEK